MYLDHFHFSERPFALTPDTDYFYNNTACQEAMNVILVALDNGEGIIKITGEVGTGKTMLCRKLLNDLPDDYVSVYLPNPLMESQQLYHAVASDLGVATQQSNSVAALLDQLNVRLIKLSASGRRVVVCVDEAQSMPTETLEALRLLTNVETEKRKLVQIVLFGQPELDSQLARNELRQLCQRISFAYRLRPLDYADFCAYLHHRLTMAGYHGAPLFSRVAQKRLFRASGGIPRLVNILAHKALLCAYGKGRYNVNGRCVAAAIADTEGLCMSTHWRLALAVFLAVSFCLGIYAAQYLGR